jgi:hypothetical protein
MVSLEVSLGIKRPTMITDFHLVTLLRMVAPYLHSSIRPHDVLVNYLSTGVTLRLPYNIDLDSLALEMKSIVAC